MARDKEKILLVLTGPTGVGKSSIALTLAERLETPIISADSRQIFKEMPIGTDAPTPVDLERVRHFFVATHHVWDYMSAYDYEVQALEVIRKVHETRNVALLVGGSMMYIDAVTHGIDHIPDPDPAIRERLWQEFEEGALPDLRAQLARLDPDYLKKIDPDNHKRIIHALEICLTTGKPFSSFHTGKAKERPFRTIMLGLDRPRAELYDRINRRVELMIERGLVDEVSNLLPYRKLNALNTVGYKEIFNYLDGKIDLQEAIRQIQKNSRVYARKQLSWYRRDDRIHWFDPEYGFIDLTRFLLQNIPMDGVRLI